jgi:type I restriction enzyme R subunit
MFPGVDYPAALAGTPADRLRALPKAIGRPEELLNGEIGARTRANVVKHEEFSEHLRDAIARSHNRSLDALQVMQELIALAKSRASSPTTPYPEEAAF